MLLEKWAIIILHNIKQKRLGRRNYWLPTPMGIPSFHFKPPRPSLTQSVTDCFGDRALSSFGHTNNRIEMSEKNTTKKQAVSSNNTNQSKKAEQDFYRSILTE
jgi:hypothetical protein